MYICLYIHIHTLQKIQNEFTRTELVVLTEGNTVYENPREFDSKRDTCVDTGIHTAGLTPEFRQLVAESINCTEDGRDYQPTIGRITTELGWKKFASSQ